MEVLDLETDICRSTDISYHVVPYKLKVGENIIDDFTQANSAPV